MPLRRIIHLASFAIAGGIVGWAYFLLMRRALGRYLKEDGGNARRFVGSMLVRFALFAAGVVAAYLVDELCVITYLAGFLVTRAVVVRRARAGLDCSNGTR
jgi:hypothetical protein